MLGDTFLSRIDHLVAPKGKAVTLGFKFQLLPRVVGFSFTLSLNAFTMYVHRGWLRVKH